MGNERKIHWKNWGNLTPPKVEGGMGFWDLRLFNYAMLAIEDYFFGLRDITSLTTHATSTYY